MNVVLYQSDQTVWHLHKSNTIFRDGKMLIWGGTSQIFRTYQKSGLLTEYFQNINIENIKKYQHWPHFVLNRIPPKDIWKPDLLLYNRLAHFHCTAGWLTFTFYSFNFLFLIFNIHFQVKTLHFLCDTTLHSLFW